MSPVERLQAAIEKLEHLKAASTPGDWEVDTNHPFSRDLVGLFSESVKAYAVKFDDDEQPARATVDLIVTLHRTIDAQLETLHAAWNTIAGTEEMPEGRDPRVWYGRYAAAGLALADAILGGDR